MKKFRACLVLLCFTLLVAGCEKDEHGGPLTGNSILKFMLWDYGVCGTINHDEGTIKVEAAALVDLTSVKLMLVLSEGSSVSPPATEPFDLTAPVTFEVTSGAGVSRSYTVLAEQYTDTALVIVDIQNGYLPFYMSDSVLARNRRLIDRARAAAVTVVFVQADYTSWDGGMQSPKGTWEFEVPDTLGPTPDDLYVTKTVQDSFDESTTLVGLLNDHSIGSCIITGIATQACVNGTVEGGLHRGYRLIVAADAHSSFDPGAQMRIDSFNETWASLGAIVMNSGEINFNGP